LEPPQNKHWLGPLLVSAWLRSRRKIASHLFCLNVGLKMIPRERRRSRSKMARLLAALHAMSAAGEAGMKETVRLT
jgi:aminoglycoside phosphotransferase (APT) family kinase protein